MKNCSQSKILIASLSVVVFSSVAYAQRLEDRTTDPLFPFSTAEKVVDLDLPPGNIAVSKGGRIFFTFLPQAKPDIKVAELVGGRVVPYPNEAFQNVLGSKPGFRTVLSVRVDQQNRLWTLDYGSYGFKRVRLYAFDLTSNELIHSYEFSAEMAPVGSMLNDFQVDAAGRKIFISDSGVINQKPAIVYYDIEQRKAYRLLENHLSVTTGPYDIYVHDKKVKIILGTRPLKLGVDAIALDQGNEWLYFAATNSGTMYRLRISDIEKYKEDPAKLSAAVEEYAKATMSDGMVTDEKGNLYLTDMEHSAIVRLTPQKALETVLKDPKMRWPDGFSFAPGGWLYLTCSAMNEVLNETRVVILRRGPYPIFRFRP